MYTDTILKIVMKPPEMKEDHDQALIQGLVASLLC